MDQLFNTKDYTTLELILFAGGCYLWVIAYAVDIVDIYKKRCIDMAVFAAAGNIAWEFVWSWIPPTTDMGLALVWAYRIWFFFDIYIFAGIVMYGMKQITVPALRNIYKPMIILTAIAQALIYLTFKKQGYDTPIGANSAYLLQLGISSLCVILILRQPPGVYFSYSVGWLRSVGTGMNTVFMVIHYPHNYFVQIVAILSTLLDTVYVTIFVLKRRANKSWNVELMNAPDPLEKKIPLKEAVLATT